MGSSAKVSTDTEQVMGVETEGARILFGEHIEVRVAAFVSTRVDLRFAGTEQR